MGARFPGGAAELPFLTLRSAGSAGDGSNDDVEAIQAAFDDHRSDNPWLDGEGRTYKVSAPIVLGPSQKLRNLKLSASDGSGAAPAYGPVATPMVLNSQGGFLTFTANPATDVITTASEHDLPSDDVMVLFKGSALPGGLTAGQIYYVRDRTATTFKVAATPGGAAVDITSAGSGGTVYLEVASLQKVYLDDVHIDGSGVAEYGARLYLQQQSACRKLRIDNCALVGLHLTGQQAIFENFQSLNNPVGVALDNASFMDFYGFNVEAGVTGVYVWDSSGPFGGGAFTCLFSGVHMEQNDIPAAVAFDLGGPHELTIDTASFSMNLNGQIVVYQYCGDVTASDVTLRNMRVIAGGAGSRPTMIQDDDRVVTLDSWDYFRFRGKTVHIPAKPTSDLFTDPGPITIIDPQGELVQMGATTPGLPRIVTPSLKVTGGIPAAGKVLTSDADGVATWEAAGGGGAGDGGVRLPDAFEANRPVSVGIGVNGGAGAFTTDRCVYVPLLWIDRTRDFAGIELNVTAEVPGSAIRFGLYADAGGKPGALVTDFGTVASDVTGIRSIAAAFSLDADVHWVAVCFQGGAPQVTRLQPVTLSMFPAFADAPWAIAGEDGISGALPDPANAAFNLQLNWPAVCLRTA